MIVHHSNGCRKRKSQKRKASERRRKIFPTSIANDEKYSCEATTVMGRFSKRFRYVIVLFILFRVRHKTRVYQSPNKRNCIILKIQEFICDVYEKCETSTRTLEIRQNVPHVVHKNFVTKYYSNLFVKAQLRKNYIHRKRLVMPWFLQWRKYSDFRWGIM